MKALISDLAFDLIQAGLDQLKEIYNRYSHTDFDAEAEEIEANVTGAMKSMMEEMFGEEFDDADLSSTEQIHEAIQQKINANRESALHQESKRTPRKKPLNNLKKKCVIKKTLKTQVNQFKKYFAN